MAALSPAQIANVWVSNGGKSDKATVAIAVAVALAESGGDPNNTNHNTDGSTDRGLWQINSVHGAQSTYDLNANAKAAVAISGNGSNWGPWTTYTSGRYKQFASQGAQGALAAAAGPSAASQLAAPAVGAANAIGGAASSVANTIAAPFNAAAGVLAFFTSTSNWLRIGEAIAGIILIAMGLKALTGQSTPGISKLPLAALAL